MKIMNKYDYDKDLKERYVGTTFLIGETEVFNSHCISYVHAREQMQKMGLVMGLERLTEEDKK